MAEIAFILLCHKNPGGIIDQVRGLIGGGDRVAIHFDARSPRAEYELLKTAFANEARVTFARRVRCGWGQWSLVQATLNGLNAAHRAFPGATHFLLLSGDCAPIKSAEYCHDYIDREDVDFIESEDFFTSGWIKTGFCEERLIYHHLFNERGQKWLYYASIDLQRRLGVRRKIPADLQMRIGSQWWCLRRRTVETLLGFIAARRDVVRFFRRTWIPDESFFQTLVYHLVARDEIRSRGLTFLMFSDYGMPVTFYNDHFDLLLTQDYLFARKISPEAAELKSRLSELYAETGRTFTISNEGQRLYTFLTAKGRVGQRFAPRFWERDATIGRDRELLIVTCKKWHVARRFVDRVSFVSNVPATDFLFDQEDIDLPDLGGIQATIRKRTRHRRALVRMLFDYFETDRLMICLDPSNLDLLHDFYADRSETRMLEIECEFSDDYLAGHARRVGLAGEETPPETLRRLLPTIRNDVLAERDAIREQSFPEFFRVREKAPPEVNADQIAGFLSISSEGARQIAATDNFFAD